MKRDAQKAPLRLIPPLQIDLDDTLLEEDSLDER
jgi:hypothetical protein